MMGTREIGMARCLLVVGVCLACIGCVAQAAPRLAKTNQNSLAFFQTPPKSNNTAMDISGTYSFLREGEFLDLTIDDGQLSGFISRFGDTESDKGEFIDHFFDKATLQGDHLSFKTKTVHAIWYEFDGTVATAAGKQKGEDGYRTLSGKLTLHKADATGKEQFSERTVQFKSFPDMRHMKN